VKLPPVDAKETPNAMTALPTTGREVHLVARPEGWPTPDLFAVREAPVTEPGPGQILVRNLHISVDPYMRGRMNDVKSYVPPFALNEVMDGAAVGRVIASGAEGVAVGDHVTHGLGWREYATLEARHAAPVEPGDIPLSAWLGVLGVPGWTAYAGLVEVAELVKGETVFVSGAAGAVGTAAGQIARLLGAARVVGSAGSPEKVRLLTEEYGFDAAFNYKDGPVDEQLAQAAPDGIDVYFDNVGGDHLEAALARMNLHGRVVLCGAIAQYNATGPVPGPRNLALAIGKRIGLLGMMVMDHVAIRPRFERDVTAWIRSGDLRYQETVVEGIENAPAAFLGMLRGENVGKMVVTLPE
jgi:NADPH-dependent curcumin reductase CurA